MLLMSCPAVFPSGLSSSNTRTSQALLFESCNSEAAFFFRFQCYAHNKDTHGIRARLHCSGKMETVQC